MEHNWNFKWCPLILAEDVSFTLISEESGDYPRPYSLMHHMCYDTDHTQHSLIKQVDMDLHFQALSYATLSHHWVRAHVVYTFKLRASSAQRSKYFGSSIEQRALVRHLMSSCYQIMASIIGRRCSRRWTWFHTKASYWAALILAYGICTLERSVP